MGLFGDIIGAVSDKAAEVNDKIDQAKQKYKSKNDAELCNLHKKANVFEKAAIVQILKSRGWDNYEIDSLQ